MAQTLHVAQTTYVPACITEEPKFIISEKFDGTRSKFRDFVQQVNLFLRLHPSHYPDDSVSGFHRLIIIRECPFLVCTIFGKAFAGFIRHLE
jgi:hypothetical protein